MQNCANVSQKKLPINQKDFINLISLALAKHGCSILDIDLRTHIINISSGHTSEAEIDAAEELSRLFGQYEVLG